MCCNITILEDHDILLAAWQADPDIDSVVPFYLNVLDTLTENQIEKMISDYRLVDLNDSKQLIKQMLRTFLSFERDNVYHAIITVKGDLLENTINNDLTDNKELPSSQVSKLKYKIFEDLSLALDWLKSI